MTASIYHVPVNDETVCQNCKKKAKDHCQEPFHFLQCCPGKCPAAPGKDHQFSPPQPPKVPTKDELEALQEMKP